MQELPQIPGYRIIKKLGQGGMADVYLGVQENLARQVAIKVLIPSLFRDEQFSARFIKEAQTAAHLIHPNIITIHDVNKHGNFYYIVMEYLEESLSQRMKKVGVLPPEEALEIIKMIASALDYAHRKGIIHRDIKPDNIMFRADGTVVLVDFGIARAMDSATQLTRTGMSIGTPHYMSPEQCRGEKIDGRSDFYSLGVELFELLTGNVPYNAENTAGIIIKHIQSPIPHLPPHLSYWQPLIDKMMAKERQDRIANGKELIFFIEALLHTRTGPEIMPPLPLTDFEMETVKLPPVVIPKPTTPIEKQTRIEPQQKKNLSPILIVASLVVVAAITLFIVLTRSSKPTNTEDTTISEPQNEEPQNEEQQNPVEQNKTTTNDSLSSNTSTNPRETTTIVATNANTTTNKAKPGEQKKTEPATKETPPKETPIKDQPVKETQVTEEPVTEQPKDKPEVIPKKDIQAEERENLKRQLELDKQYQSFLQQAHEYVAAGNYEKALDTLAEARKLKQTGQLAELEQSIRQAREKRLRKTDSPAGIKVATVLDLAPELRKEYNMQLQHLQITLPRASVMFQVKGSITCNLEINENGTVSGELLEENLEITPPRREVNVKGIIAHRINNLTLAAPKDKSGQSIRITGWRVSFKVGKYMNTINLIKQ